MALQGIMVRMVKPVHPRVAVVADSAGQSGSCQWQYHLVVTPVALNDLSKINSKCVKVR